MIKRGDITDATPQPGRQGAEQAGAGQPLDKKAADKLEDHTTVRLVAGVADAIRERRKYES